MIVKIFSGSNMDAIQDQIQGWLDFLNDAASDSDNELQIISVTQSESDGIINITIIAK